VAGAEARQLHALPACEADTVSRPHSAWSVLVEVAGGPEEVHPLLLDMAPQLALCRAKVDRRHGLIQLCCRARHLISQLVAREAGVPGHPLEMGVHSPAGQGRRTL